MLSLLRSRKFWLAMFGVTQTVVLHYLDIPDEVWQSIAALVGVLIVSIAAEDAAAKRAGSPTPTADPFEGWGELPPYHSESPHNPDRGL
jgi:hypothetical protein